MKFATRFSLVLALALNPSAHAARGDGAHFCRTLLLTLKGSRLPLADWDTHLVGEERGQFLSTLSQDELQQLVIRLLFFNPRNDSKRIRAFRWLPDVLPRLDQTDPLNRKIVSDLVRMYRRELRSIAIVNIGNELSLATLRSFNRFVENWPSTRPEAISDLAALYLDHLVLNKDNLVKPIRDELAIGFRKVYLRLPPGIQALDVVKKGLAG